MFSAFVNTFKIPELRTRIFYTCGLLFVCRIVASVPTPGVDAEALSRAIAEIQSRVGGGILGLVDMFSGGAMQNCAIGALGIMPYITASIILQLMTAVVPTLERLAKEGDVGRQKITQYTRYLTVGLCVMQGFFMAKMLENPGAALGISETLVSNPGLGFRLLTVITMTGGTLLLMWLGEQITERGIGNGISIIITVNIISGLPGAVQLAGTMFFPSGDTPAKSPFLLIFLLAMAVLVIAGTIAVTQALRKIPVHHAKRVVGRKVYGGQNTFMPLRVNYAGVMPIIFAQAILMFPAKLFNFIPLDFFRTAAAMMNPGSWLYLLIYGTMIMFFSYFWVATQFNPIEIADYLKKNGGYVPGIRPGRPTAEFLDHTMTRITLAGAVFLTVIAVIPTVMSVQFKIPFLVSQFFGGTSLLIIVGVVLDTMRQVEVQLHQRHYDGFLKKGRLRGRR